MEALSFVKRVQRDGQLHQSTALLYSIEKDNVNAFDDLHSKGTLWKHFPLCHVCREMGSYTRVQQYYTALRKSMTINFMIDVQLVP